MSLKTEEASETTKNRDFNKIRLKNCLKLQGGRPRLVTFNRGRLLLQALKKQNKTFQWLLTGKET